MTSNQEENHTPSELGRETNDTHVLKPREKVKNGLKKNKTKTNKKKKQDRIKQGAIRFEQVKRCILLTKYFK